MKTIVTVIFLVFVILIGMQELEKDRAIFYESLNGQYISDSATNSSDSDEEMVIVTLSGNIAYPGEYEIEMNSTLDDAILLAGGELEDTDYDTYDPNLTIDGNKSFYIPKTNDNEKISLNEGDLEDFKTLPGIGTTLATRIVDYRDTNGSFEQLEDIMNVSGIGNTIFDNIKDCIIL